MFIAYVAAWIVILDIQVNVEEPERKPWEKAKKISYPISYKLTIIWGIILVLSGIYAIYVTNKYRSRYAFECDTYLVDNQKGIYHVKLNDECDEANKADELYEMYGYEINKSYSLCESCKEFLEDMESYDSERFIRR